MSDKKKTDTAFTNEDTIVRRAWIESALESARGQVDSVYPDTDAAISNARIDQPNAGQDAEKRNASPERRRHLHLAWSAPERRSGT